MECKIHVEEDVDLYYVCLGMLYSRINDEMNISCKMESETEVGKCSGAS